MKRILQVSLLLLVFGASRVPSAAAFTSLYVFGDGLSTTTNLFGQSSPGLPSYYGSRFCNGRVWVEVLAQRQQLEMKTNNHSFFGHYSENLKTNVVNFVPPPDPNSGLVVIWVNNADFVDFMARFPAPYTASSIPIWTNAMNQALSNHVTAVETLYAKGVRTLVMPNAVDITKAPNYNFFAATNKAFVRQRIIEFNSGFSNRLVQLRLAHSDLRIVSPDFFTLTDGILANPVAYGMTNSTGNVLEDVANTSFTGPGTNFVFWDYLHPTAKVHEILADTAQNLISPARISAITFNGGIPQVSVVNLPVGLSGFVEGTTNFAVWSQAQSFNSTNATQTISVPASGPMRFYRLRFPFAWSWP